MYQPPDFQVDDLQVLHGLIRDHALGLLVAHLDEGLEASHVPVMVDPALGSQGGLVFHLARANPLASALDGSREVLFVFQGESAYISPDWYSSAHMVPTWNYAVVHAHGRPGALDDDDLSAALDALSASQEQRLDKLPWTSDRLPTELYARMRRAITGFRMPIERLHGKWKMSQNRSVDDRRGVIRALSGLPSPAAGEAARVMKEMLDQPATKGDS